MKRLFYKLAFWFITLSWAGIQRGCDKDYSLYGPPCYFTDCEKGYVCWDEHDGECYKACETDEDCAGEYQGANYSYYPGDCTTIICNPDQGICWDGCETCFEDKHCEDGQVCEDNQCEWENQLADEDEQSQR